MKKIYPPYIMENVRQSLGLEKNDRSKDEYIMSLEPKDVFNKYCIWEGLLGYYGYTLWDVVKDIEKCKTNKKFKKGIDKLKSL